MGRSQRTKANVTNADLRTNKIRRAARDDLPREGLNFPVCPCPASAIVVGLFAGHRLGAYGEEGEKERGGGGGFEVHVEVAVG